MNLRILPLFSISNRKGSTLIIVLEFLSILSLLSLGVVNAYLTDMKIQRNINFSRESFYHAEAGIELARGYLRSRNQKSTLPYSFRDELQELAEQAEFKDDFGWRLELPAAGETGEKISFKVYLKDKKEKNNPFFSAIRSLIITSIGQGGVDNQILRATLTLFQKIPFLPGTITLLGGGVNFIGNKNPVNIWNGNDLCGSDPSKPVIAVSESGSYLRVREAVENSLPFTYTTNHPLGVVQEVAGDGRLDLIARDFFLDLREPRDLKKIIERITPYLDTKIKKRSESKRIDLGTKEKPVIALAEDDFILNKDGAGILIVEGALGIEGNITYEGLILVIGEGVVILGKGNQTIKGGLLAANIDPGNDGLLDTEDDKLGNVLFDASQADSLFISACSRSIYSPLHKLPLGLRDYILLGSDI